MKHLLLFLLPGFLAAQYFQQRVDYRIEARLDDKKHELHAYQEIDYTNNAPEALDTLIFHLWPRAFSSDQTAFAKQKLRDGSTRFHFAENSQRGTLDSLDFKVDGETIEWHFSPRHPDIAYLSLNEAIPPGGKVTITTPFRVKIPASFSRLGHVGDSYQMTQWYPKPAVYDQDGWHPMPYLDRGEFYSEFGSFDVSLTLPENYIVGATGMLQTESEMTLLREKARIDEAELNVRNDLSTAYVSEPYPPSAEAFKTIRYVADRVHDFAWFADKRFKVLHMGANNPQTGNRLDFWSFFTETEAEYWKESLVYLEHAIEFYSEKVGLYPYPQVTAVQSALSAGAGMEYPMITVIGRNTSTKDLDEVLAHEVGHNWFYAILATNERTDPWLDEGFNSYYEGLYMQRWYPEHDTGLPAFGGKVDLDLLGYRYQNRLGKMQSPAMDSDSMAAENYWLNAYSKPDLALQHLALVYGPETVDQAMQAYFQQWQFKHPRPRDVKAVFEESTNLDLDWLFDGFLQSDATFDVYLAKGNGDSVLIKRNGDIDAPVLVTAQSDPGTPSMVVASIPESGYALPPGSYHVNAGPLDLYPDNNVSLRPFKIGILTGVEAREGEKRGYVSPLAGFTAQNGLMLGTGFHNRTLEPRRLEFLLSPFYGFKSNSINGFAGLRWRNPLGQSDELPGLFKNASVDFGIQRFAYREFRGEPYHYIRTAFNAKLPFEHAPITQLKSGVEIQAIDLRESRPTFDSEGNLLDPSTTASFFGRVSYYRERDREINPNNLRITLETGFPDQLFAERFLKIDLTLRGGYQYQKSKFIRWRFFGGYFLQNDLRDRNFSPNYAYSLVGNAASDYAYDDLYLGRQDDRSYGQQLSERMGGFRAPTNRAFGFGLSNNYMATANLDFDLPFTPPNFPLGVFLDAGVYDRSPIRSSSESAFQWVGGLSLTFLNGAVGVYAPLVSSPELGNILDQRGGLLQQLSFRLSMQQLLPWRWLDEIGL